MLHTDTTGQPVLVSVCNTALTVFMLERLGLALLWSAFSYQAIGSLLQVSVGIASRPHTNFEGSPLPSEGAPLAPTGVHCGVLSHSWVFAGWGGVVAGVLHTSGDSTTGGDVMGQLLSAPGLGVNDTAYRARVPCEDSLSAAELPGMLSRISSTLAHLCRSCHRRASAFRWFCIGAVLVREWHKRCSSSRGLCSCGCPTSVGRCPSKPAPRVTVGVVARTLSCVSQSPHPVYIFFTRIGGVLIVVGACIAQKLGTTSSPLGP